MSEEHEQFDLEDWIKEKELLDLKAEQEKIDFLLTPKER